MLQVIRFVAPSVDFICFLVGMNYAFICMFWQMSPSPTLIFTIPFYELLPKDVPISW